jgi:hypothetical protein
MAGLRFLALPTVTVRAYHDGARDAYGCTPERRTADGSGLPCRHCLSEIDVGDDYLILAHRPFQSLQPYAETGPIFVHAKPCRRHPEPPDTPAAFLKRPQMMLRGYDIQERIVYGTGSIVSADRIAEKAATILENPDVAFVDLRSASNNCFQCRVVRAPGSQAP